MVTWLEFVSADPNIMDLLQNDHSEILAGIGVRFGNSGFPHIKALIYLKRPNGARYDQDYY